MRLLIMGPPGAGKGTQAVGVAEHYGIPAISTGSIFRQNVADGTELGKQVKAIMESGGYVPDELTVALVKDRLAQPDAANGWLLDGFPRTLGQVQALDDMGAVPDAVISIVCDTDALVGRMLKRAEIEGRADDNETTIRKRFEVYAEQTDPLLAVYAERGKVVEVQGMGTIDEVAGRITSALDAKLGA